MVRLDLGESSFLESISFPFCFPRGGPFCLILREACPSCSTMVDKVVVRYKTFELRKSDLEFLKSPCYITDRLIEFYFGWLSEKFDTGKNILLVPPCVSYWISLGAHPDDIMDCTGNWDPDYCMLFLLPVINDEGGANGVESTQSLTHWSLLVYDNMQRLFFHFDDAHEDTVLNHELASRICENVKSLLPREEETEQGQARPPKLWWVKATAQEKGFNKYDSGLHVMAMAKTICKWFTEDDERIMDGEPTRVKPFYMELIQDMDVSAERDIRSEIKVVIEKIAGKNYKELLM